MVKADPLAGQRKAILALLLILAAVAWVVLIRQSVAGGEMSAMGPTMGFTAPLFLAIWVVMMIAMMFPTAAPMILVFHRIQASKQKKGQAFTSTWIFISAYLAIWTIAGIVAFAAGLLTERFAQSAKLTPTPEAAARIGGVLIVAAGLYQLSPLKRVCLSHCRAPLSFIMNSWRDGAAGAIQMGILHGMYCLGCCMLLFVLLFPIGIMNIAAMAMITALIFAEKVLPWGGRAAQAAAVALILYGTLVLVVPSVFPTIMMGEPSMQMDGTSE